MLFTFSLLVFYIWKPFQSVVFAFVFLCSFRLLAQYNVFVYFVCICTLFFSSIGDFLQMSVIAYEVIAEN